MAKIAEKSIMCRLFGFRSVILSQVHTSLIHADNALGQQSLNHPDGWGVSYYLAGAPHIIKSSQTALEDKLFQKVSGVVSSQTVLAHVRKATTGQIDILNTHPFQFGHWTFAHNGNIKDFEKYRAKIVKKIPLLFRRFILGNTDSEVIFFFILSYLEKEALLESRNCPIDLLAKTVQKAIHDLIKIAGPYSQIDDAGEQETYLTFILTNGTAMLAHHGGKKLYYSTYKKKCPDRKTCPSFALACEAPTQDGFVNHLLFSSEPLIGENIWEPMQIGEIVGVDHRMKIEFFSQEK